MFSVSAVMVESNLLGNFFVYEAPPSWMRAEVTGWMTSFSQALSAYQLQLMLLELKKKFLR